ncbi:hypothetical protein OROMI_018638 [Orobanche minor]
MDDKGKYLLSLRSGTLLGSDSTLATSKLLLRQSGRECANVDFIDSNIYMFKTSDSSNSTNKTANYIEAPSDTVVVKGLPQKTTEEDLYQILDEWGPIHHIRVIKEQRSGISRGFAFVDFPYVGATQTMMDRFGHEGLLIYDSKLFFEYSFDILGVAGGLFQPHLGEKMLRKPNFRMLPCSDRGCSGCYEETIVGCCLEMDLSGRVGYSSASQAGASTIKGFYGC